MRAKREFRNRDATQVAVLDALVERGSEGMTVLELRTRVDAEIDALDDALTTLKTDGLIEADTRSNDRVVLVPAAHVVPEGDEEAEPSLVERLRDRLPF
ncbi:DUF6432 family protein [Halomarina ordinaria]|uniref:DUF6432 family protein n=1 Tax=Halomarina ordinaria TaxID=3033939 RepID=A0ABD5UAT3_9EURY|nr:DUF6432 family protein [Halomarina sp. PSRA2]